MWQQSRRPVPNSLPWRQVSLDQIPASYSGITAPNKSKITKEEHRAIKELREEQTRVVLMPDKGLAMVVMDKQDYTDKILTLLTDTSTYNTISKDPTTRLRTTLITTLKDIKQKGGLSDTTYRKVYPTSAVPPKFYGLPKINKIGTPLRPIVSSRGSITYGVAKELAGLICLLVGLSPHHLRTIQHFVQHIEKARLKPEEVMASYDVKALFTSVPMDPSIQIVKQKLQQDPTLPNRTNMSIPHIVTLLEFFLKNTYFLFQGKYYKQVHGAALGSPISPLIAKLFMEKFEVKALSTAPHPLHLWLRFDGDIYVMQKAEQSQLLLWHINTQDPPYSSQWRSPIKMDHFHPGHPSFTRSQQHPLHDSFKETNTYRPVSTWGQ